jgi:hypothetical protein
LGLNLDATLASPKSTLRDIFLIARPPLLAVMRGGVFRSLQFICNSFAFHVMNVFYERPHFVDSAKTRGHRPAPSAAAVPAGLGS